jgi:hypothetical protein
VLASPLTLGFTTDQANLVGCPGSSKVFWTDFILGQEVPCLVIILVPHDQAEIPDRLEGFIRSILVDVCFPHPGEVPGVIAIFGFLEMNQGVLKADRLADSGAG